MGSNVAENHPVSFKWIQAAKDKGAIFIHVDPRFTRTSTKADIFARLRSGTDIAFLGGMIKYILDNKLYDEFYVKNYTNASFIVNPRYSFDDGLFSGYNPSKRAYDASTWAFEKDEKGIPKQDMTLQHERCVFQLLKKHYSRYTLEKVTEITGTPCGRSGEGLQGLCLDRSSRQGGNRPICHGLDPAYGRCPEYPRHVHHPVPSREHGDCGWRGQCPARGVECPGINGPGPSLSHLARISAHTHRPNGQPLQTITRPPRPRKTLEVSTGGETGQSMWPVS